MRLHKKYILIIDQVKGGFSVYYGRSNQYSFMLMSIEALIDYPTYICQTTGAYTSPERAIVELAKLKKTGEKTLPFWRKILRDLIKLWNHSSFSSNP